MPKITTVSSVDERSYQDEFYSCLYGDNDKWKEYVNVDRSTDGYTEGILFEHKTNVTSYGEAKALSQAIIYLTRFNRDGVPVPRYVCLVSQEEEKIFVYDMKNYLPYINDIEQYANMQASKGIPNFQNRIGRRMMVISYELGSYAGMKDIASFVERPAETLKVNITSHNVYGWSVYYYDHAKEFHQKPEKKAFFNELRHPVGTLRDYINPWTGRETDFKYIMDMLNDPATQKQIGCFYTPEKYCGLAEKLVLKAIKRVPDGNDYIILDRAGGTGQLISQFSDEILSHVVISTYELKEWMVLKDRFGDRVRYICPPIPKEKNQLPDLNEEGFLSGANALTRDILDNESVMKYVKDPNCNIICFENPPFVEGSRLIKDGDKTIVAKGKSDWKSGFVPTEMAKEVSGVALNDMGNVFIWSAFKYFLTKPEDSYIVFSPVKYWKAHHLVNKKFADGFAFNRKAFHAPTDACIMCAYYENIEDKMTNTIKLKAINLTDDNLHEEGFVYVKKVYSTMSDYYDKRKFNNDDYNAIVFEMNGSEALGKKPTGITPIYNENILGYLVANNNTFDAPRQNSMLLSGGVWKGHGFYLRNDNFVEKFPLFAASRYTDNYNNWKVMSMVMKSADRKEAYEADVKKHKLDKFLCQCLIWCCLTHYAHMRSLYGSDGRFYRNELCFDGDTIAKRKLDEFIKNGYVLTEQEKEMFDKYNMLLEMVKSHDENTGKPKENYNPEYTYGLYQIDEEINLKDPVDIGNGKTRNRPRYGDMDNLIKEIKKLLKQYYIDNLADTLFEYEFLK